ncbi:unnamed protein product [Cochlearia groenlandica]
MTTPIQPPTEEVSPPPPLASPPPLDSPPLMASPPLEPSSPGAMSPATEPIDGNSPEIPNPPPPLSSPPIEPSPSSPPPSRAPPPAPTLSEPPPPSSESSPPPPAPISSEPPPPSESSPPPPAPISSEPPLPPSPESSPPPQLDQPTISPPPPPSTPSVPPAEITNPPPTLDPPLQSPPPSTPSVPPPEITTPPPTLDPPLHSPPPPPSDPPPSPLLSPPAPERPAQSPPPPVSERPAQSPPPPVSERPAQSPPPPPASKRPLQSPPPRAPERPVHSPPSQHPSPSPPASQRPTHPPPPPQSPELPEQPPPPDSKPPARSPPRPPRDSELPELTPPPPKETTPPPKPSPSSVPSNSSSPPTSPSVLSPHLPPQRFVPGSGSPSQDSPTPTVLSNSSGSGIGRAAVVGVSIGVALLLLISLIGVFVWCLKRRKKSPSAIGGDYATPSPTNSVSRSDSALLKTHSSAPLVGNRSSTRTYFSGSEPGGFGQSKELFSYEDLVTATNGFSDENLLGEGGFGRVYKGVLQDGRVVAVKQLKIGGGQGDREFKAEVDTISRVHHRHLLSLIGYCISENQRLLIYDYVPNNNLYFHLHAAEAPGLDWATRVKIAAGAARGLAYLHEDCHPRIIHRDIKSSNILLENNFHALVSDFGLAKLALDCNTHITTRVMGTFGYMAPEYASSGKLTEKSDVFSFGVVLLELITGRKPVDTSQPLGDESLVEWARPLLSHAIETEELKALADPKLGGNYVDVEMFRMIEAAGACIRHSATKRPRMSQIVRAFESLAEEEDLTNGMRLGESEIINSAEQSAEIRLFRRMAFGSQNYSTDFFTHNIPNNRDENV